MRLRLPLALVLATAALAAPPALAQPKPDAPKTPSKSDGSKSDGSKGDGSKGDGSKGDGSKGEPKDEARIQAQKLLAKQAEERMADLVRRGKEACERSDFEQGLPALTAAWSQKGDADVAAALGACEAQAGRWPSATEHLAAALRVKEDGPDRKRLEEIFVDARKRVGGVKVNVNVEGADIIVGDLFVGQSPLPGEVYVEAGKRVVISAKKPGFDEAEKAVQVGAKSTVEITLQLSPTGTGGNRYASASRSRVPLILLGGLALVAGGVGASLYAAALSKEAAADAMLAELQKKQKYACQPAQAGCSTVSDLRASRDTLMNAGTGVLIGGGVLLGGAILAGAWAFSGGSATSASAGPLSRTASISAMPVVSADGAGLFVRGAF